MLRGLYSSVSSMITLQERQNIITNNIANSNTNGYKEKTLVSKSFDEVLLHNNDSYSNGIANRENVGKMSFGCRIDETPTNYKQGVLKESDNNTDFAIEGNGFFEVRDANNNVYYTRDGAFKIDAQGYLVTSGGYYVMNENSQRINVGNNSFTVSSDNRILIDGQNAPGFKVVDFSDYKSLEQREDNLFTGENGTTAQNYEIRQKYLESSNVDAINSTASLLETVREFEANQKVIQTIDSTLSKVANEIGAVQ